jgi:plasmid maintenance system antidote protein VapI
MPKPRKPLSLTQILRAELAAVESVNAVAQATGLSQPTLARFLRGDTDSLTFDTASVLLDHFDYVIVKRTAAAKPKAKRAAKR